MTARHCAKRFTAFGPGGFYIARVPINGGEPVQVTTKPSRLPEVSPDGKLFACYYRAEPTYTEKLALFPFDGGDPVRVFDLPTRASRVQAVRWTPDGRALTYIVARGLVSNIWAQPVDGGAPKQLTDFKTDFIYSFDWSRDGKWLACSRGVVNSDVVLISNFR